MPAGYWEDKTVRSRLRGDDRMKSLSSGEEKGRKTASVPARAGLLCLPFLLLGGAAIFSPLVIKLGQMMPECYFRAMTTLYCPGCGMTRAVMALFRGDVAASLRYNPVPAAAVILALLLYGEAVGAAFGKRVRLFPRSAAFWIAAGSLFAVYAVLRNIIPEMRPV